MPLDKSGSKASVGNNIRIERRAGRPERQAVAIALSVQRRAKGSKAKPGRTRDHPQGKRGRK